MFLFLRAGAARRDSRRRDARARRSSVVMPLCVAVLLPVLGFTWLAGERTATVVIDGAPSDVRTHAATVGDLLQRMGLDVGPSDRVVPSTETPVADGMVIEVVHAREITVLLGDTLQSVTVAALTVDDVLDELQPRLASRRGAVVRPSRLARVQAGMVVAVVEPVALTVVHDGGERQLITDATTVAEVLDRLPVRLGPRDIVIPPLDAPTQDGMTIAVRRVEVLGGTRRETVPFPTEERQTDALARGEERQVQAGRDGEREVVEQVEHVDGEEWRRAVIAERVTREPRPRIVEVGTAPPAPRPSAAPAPQPPPQPAPSPAPAAPANVQEGNASWYDNPSGGMTAAHRTLPRGTIVTVTNLANGKQVQVRINDRGPFVAGRVVDLNREAFSALAPTSAGVIRVRVEW